MREREGKIQGKGGQIGRLRVNKSRDDIQQLRRLFIFGGSDNFKASDDPGIK